MTIVKMTYVPSADDKAAAMALKRKRFNEYLPDIAGEVEGEAA